MPPSFIHFLRSLIVAILAGLLFSMIFVRSVRFGPVLFVGTMAWIPALAVGFPCALASWKLRHARSGVRAGAAGFFWGGVITITLAAVVALATTSLSTYGSRWEEKILDKWSYMSIFLAPYVAVWLGLYSWWVWRREPASCPA